ncbi:MAG TPA: GAF domain-containing protein [Terriglobales bacterium]|jgi:hypothetical protein|nr:GAF domain-containing protein [Terriglobales bacterium]
MSSNPHPNLALEAVIATPELHRRVPRSRDTATERRALEEISRQLDGTPAKLLERLVELSLDLCRAQTAGLSVLYRKPDGERYFRWDAMAGVHRGGVGGTTPRDWSPCGTTLDRRSPQLFYYPHRYFTYFAALDPKIVEGLVIPIYVRKKEVGTIWIVGHDEQRKFDSYDVRVMTSIASFCGAGLARMDGKDATAA